MVSFTIIIEEGKRNFSAYCPDLPGVIATGKTEEKIIKNMREAIKFHLEGLRDDNQSLPIPISKARKVQIPKKLFGKLNCHSIPA
ncbi:MAG: type II toxin-antitoxin system HicB family antitoxin [Methanoregula sp.]